MGAEQRINIKFLAQLGKSPTETLAMVRSVYGDQTLSRARVFMWHKRFRDGREDVDDDERPGRPSSSRNEENVRKVRDLVRSDRRLSIKMMADQLGLNRETVRLVLIEDLGMRKICAKMVPRLLTDDQKQRRVDACQDILQQLEANPELLNNVITGDESWFFRYDPETKRQSLQWKTPASPRPKKARMSKSKVKTMLIVFFDHRGIVHLEFVPEGTTVNQHFYKEVLTRLIARIRRSRRDLWESKRWFLHHDNAPAHAAISIQQFLAQKQLPVLSHPPYSPDLAPCDFWLFPKVKAVVKGTHFESVQDIQARVTDIMRDLKEDDFKGCFRAWQGRMQRCIQLGGEYFEGETR